MLAVLAKLQTFTSDAAVEMKRAILQVPKEFAKKTDIAIVYDDNQEAGGLPREEVALLHPNTEINAKVRENLGARVTVLSALSKEDITDNMIIITPRDLNAVVGENTLLSEAKKAKSKIDSVRIAYPEGSLLPLFLLNTYAKAKVQYGLEQTQWAEALLREAFNRLTGKSLDGEISRILAANYIIKIIHKVIPINSEQRNQFHMIELETGVCV